MGGTEAAGVPLTARTKPAPVTAPAPPKPPRASPAGPVEPRPETDSIRRMLFHGAGGSLFGIQIVNIFLTFMTLGIYYFWGKVRVRNYLFSQSEIEKDRFAYHGTGKELLIGFLKAAVVFGSISALFNVAPLLPGGWPVKIAAVLLAYAILLVFIPVAMVGSRRYRLSRISWRGIRFSFRGPMGEFIRLFVRGTLLSLLTLGLYYPYFTTRQYAFMTDASYFGSRKFAFDGKGADLFRVYMKSYMIIALWVIAMAMVLPTVSTFVEDVGRQLFGGKKTAFAVVLGFLGLMTLLVIAYARTLLTARRQRYLWNHTRFDTARFRCTIDFYPLFFLNLTNFVILIITLGFGWPWVMVRNTRFVFDNLYLEGPLDLAAILQEAQTASPTGDALDSFLNLDTGLGPA